MRQDKLGNFYPSPIEVLKSHRMYAEEYCDGERPCMGLPSLLSDIIERRAQNGARVVFEDYTYFAANDSKLSPKGEELAETAEEFGMTREKFIALRQWVQEISKSSRERLAREMTVMYTLNEPRDRVLSVEYLTKQDAAANARTVVPGELLDLDDVYGGVMVRGTYIFVSEKAVEDGLQRYAPDDLLNGLIHERAAA
jgi:hypothetical protein